MKKKNYTNYWLNMCLENRTLFAKIDRDKYGM